MKRIDNLYQSIYDYENLVAAFGQAKHRKTHRLEVIKFSSKLENEIQLLQENFKNENLSLGDYHYFTIYDPKERRICAASFRERVIHHAIMNRCAYYFEQPLIEQTYACRLGKGQHKALLQIQRYTTANRYFLKMDIRKYFDSVDQQILKNLINHKFKDKQLLRLFNSIIDSYHTALGKGIPIGNLTSQYFANYYLNLFDHFVKEKLQVKYYVRYMDDFIILHTDKSELKKIQLHCIDFLLEKLYLTVKNGGYVNKIKHGCDFLGYRVFSQRRILNRRSKNRFIKKFTVLENDFIDGILSSTELQQRVQSIFNFAMFADSFTLRTKLIEKSPLTDY